MIFIILMSGSDAMSLPVPRLVLKSTVYLKNQFGNVGTGFMLSRKVGDKKYGKFLITNKHILREDGVGPYSKDLIVRFYEAESADSKPRFKEIAIPILKDDNTFYEIVYMHPEEDVDVVGIAITSLVNMNKLDKKIDFICLEDSILLTREMAEKEYIDAGEDLLILGYPAGIFSETNYLPLVKSGLLSSSTSEDLSITLSDDKVIKGKIYLVEGALFGGNSGGPVFVKPRFGVTRKGKWSYQVNVNVMTQMYILGVHSSSIQLTDKIYTRIFKSEESQPINVKENVAKKAEKDKIGEYIPMEKEVMLNVVFSAEYIIDILDDFEKKVNLNSSKKLRKSSD